MLDEAVARVAAGHGVKVTPELQRQARAALRLPEGWSAFVADAVRVYAIEAEGLCSCRGDAPVHDLPALLVIALAHMEWDRGTRFAVGLNDVLPLVVAADFEQTMARLKRAHAASDTLRVKQHQLCVFCAPTPAGFVSGRTARRGDTILQTLKKQKLYIDGAVYCADGITQLIDNTTTFGDVCNARRAVGLRRLAGRGRVCCLD